MLVPQNDSFRIICKIVNGHQSLMIYLKKFPVKL